MHNLKNKSASKPWVCKKNPEKTRIDIFSSNPKRRIAHVLGTEGDAEVHARLMASSPDLYEALEIAYEFIEDNLGEFSSPDDGEVLMKIKGAMNKVKGDK